jgi:serine/threonine-protein kinase
MSSGTSEQDGELRPGYVCDGYRIVSLIAAGGMGDVYEAIHEPSGKAMALKCLKLLHRDKEDARARMKMEAVVLSEIRHANVVQVYDAGVTEAGMIWIAMERLHGQTLRELLHGAGRVSIPDALYFASEVADGVRAVHDASVIHRDLKPENIFITDRKLVKVLDLGTGKFVGYGLKSTDGGRVPGTTAYMAPEQIKGMRVDGRADVYALGLIVYEMIAGRHPLADGLAGLPRAIEQVALRQLQATPKPLAEVAPGCPSYLSSLVAKAMAKDREERHPNMTALSADLRAARKRFIAENRVDESSTEPRAPRDDLREKLGAPRRTPTPPGALGNPDLSRTERRGPPEFTGGPSTTPSARDVTLEFSVSSLSTPPPDKSLAHEAERERGRPPEVANLPTRTNPLGVARRSDFTPEPLSLPGGRRSFAGVWSRRLAMTLGLGALIGVPPALLGVYGWRWHRRALSSTSAPPRWSSSELISAPPATSAIGDSVQGPSPPEPPPIAENRASPVEPGVKIPASAPPLLPMERGPRSLPRVPAVPRATTARATPPPLPPEEGLHPPPRTLPSSGL